MIKIKCNDGTLREYKKADYNKPCISQPKFIYFENKNDLKFFLDRFKRILGFLSYSINYKNVAIDGKEYITMCL